MPSHAPLFRYLRDCYRDDHRSGALLDVFASKVEERILPPPGFDVLPMLDPVELADSETVESDHASEAGEGGEVEDGFAPFRYVRQRQLAQTAWLGRGEKELLLGSFFVVGRLGRERQRICAPLWTWEHVRRDHDGVERGSAALNVSLLRALLESRLGVTIEDRATDEAAEGAAEEGSEPADGLDPVLDPVLDDIEKELDALLPRLVAVPRTASDLEQAVGVLQDAFGFARLEGEVADPETLRRLARETDGMGCVRCELLFLRRRSLDSRGVLTELARLAEADGLSQALSRLVDATPTPGRLKRKARRIEAPAILSRPQRSVVLNAESEPLSLVVGPPGTGKSFTIAAAAVDALSRGESVLIVAKTNHAVDVVADKLEAMLGLGEWVVRGGRRQYRRQLADRLDRLLEGNLPPFGQGKTESRDLESKLADVERTIGSLEQRLTERSELEIEWGEHVAGLSPEGKSGWLQSLWNRWRHARRTAELDDSRPYWQLMDDYRRSMDLQVETMSELLRHRVVFRLRRALSKDRRTLTRLRRSVTARSVSARERHFADLDQRTLLRAAPVWMVRTADVAQVLPLHRELFDLVVFDEATQCDMASAMPLLQRARRCQVVGDPRQLRHLSFLGRRHQRRLAERRGLDDDAARRFDYRDTSFLDLVNQTLGTQQQVAFLDEHFRSVPEIIEFSNREFYAERLRIMQEHPAQRFRRALELRRVAGRRTDDGVNSVEVTAVVDDVVAHVRRQADEPEEMVHSLGVLSPLRAQADALTEALAERLSDRELTRHDLRVATAYGFQGEEPDVMFLCLALDSGSHPSALRYVQRADVFNVAITRARSRQLVYTSLAAEEVPEGLLARYLEHVELGSEPPAESRWSHHDHFLREVTSRLELDGARVWPEYSVAGMKVDLVAEKDGHCLGIDLVGFPGRYAGSFDLERYRVFNRAGLRLMPLPYSAWLRDAESCVRALEDRLASS